MAVLALASAGGAAYAQALEPRDYSPTEDAAIRVLRLKPAGGDAWRASVAIANRSSSPFNTNFDCTLFDKDGQPFDNAGGAATAVPPGQEIVAQTSSFSPKPQKVACRIEFTTPTN
jgi:hypothetical protein